MNNPYAASATDFSQRGSEDALYEPEVFSWSGRIGRLRYLAYGVALFIVLSFLSGALGFVLGNGLPLRIVNMVLFGAIAVNVSIRRLYDLDASGWWAVLILVPFLNFLVWLWLVIAKGSEGENQHGPAPAENSWGVYLGAIVMPVMVIGILAAVAIPAYQAYTLNAKALNARSQR